MSMEKNVFKQTTIYSNLMLDKALNIVYNVHTRCRRGNSCNANFNLKSKREGSAAFLPSLSTAKGHCMRIYKTKERKKYEAD